MKRAEILASPVAALAALAGAGTLALKSFDSETVVSADPRQEPQTIEVATVRASTASERAFTGLISARVESNLGFRVQRKFVERLVDIGQRVQVGDPLMRIDQKDLNLELSAKESAVAVARALAVQATADEARYRNLAANAWATQQRYEHAKSAFDSANGQLAAAEAQAAVARNEAGYSLLVADADGTVVETLAEPGQVVAAGQVVVRLAHSGAREATVNLPEALRPAIGSLAQATVYGGASTRRPARLRQLSDAADPLTRTYEARYVLSGDAASAPLAATVMIWLPDTSSAHLAEVPLGALRENGRAAGVWIFDQATSTASLRSVEVRRLTQETAIVTGVNPGERVAALGVHLLIPGARVRVASSDSAIQ